uniref:SFRICE_010766 n=1 Tax=Spodoptera frugiperda TaxID=7108 RepID=A0A2H1X0W4_SPOFR
MSANAEKTVDSIETKPKSTTDVPDSPKMNSQAILADKTLYVSGVLGLDMAAQLVSGGAEAQARQALENLRHVLEAGGASLESVVKTNIYLGRMEDFQAINQVYGEFFPKDYPARATFQVGKLPLDAAVEIEAIALSGDLVVAEAGPCPCART